MIPGEKEKLDCLSTVFIHLPTETKDSVLKTARALLSIQGKDEWPLKEKKDAEKKAD
ncbi:hypothetical protein AGMMS4952_07790 [Spirochaetia bacterium]|nr:hypothetical protein AGMMS4952_07790 [Spirochaetia bacterium]